MSQWYPPEQAPFGKMMQELAAHAAGTGWDVTVITGFPNHPSGQVFGGFRKRWLATESEQGVTLKRVWLFTSNRNGLLQRLIRFATFTLTSLWRLAREPGVDVIFAVLQPLSMGAFLPLMARLKGARLVLNVQDLHPDTQIRLGLVRNPLLIRLLRAVEAYAYRNCSALVVICEPFRSHVIARGAAADRVAIVENWIDTDRVQPLAGSSPFRAEAGLSADDFVVLWAGTLGYVSGAAILVEAAERLRDRPNIRFLVVGEGPLRPTLEARVRELGLRNVIFRPFQPEERLAEVQASGDVSLVVLSAQFAESSVPSKVLAYMAAGRAIIAAVPPHSPTAVLIERAAAGVIVQPDDAPGLAQAIETLAANRDEAHRLGAAARYYVVANLSKSAGVAGLETAVRRALASP